MLDKILLDSRHKFVYFEEGTLKFDDIISENLEGITIPVYIKDNGLLDVNSVLKLDGIRIRSFHNSYYDFLIALAIIDKVIELKGKDFLNKKMRKIFRFYSKKESDEIKDIDDFRTRVYESLIGYKEMYINYIKNSSYGNLDDLPIIIMLMDMFVSDLKEAIGFDGYFSILYDYDEISTKSMMSLNNYISSRCNKDLSINILCGNKEWKCYYDCMGNFIENIHDYVEIYDTNSKRRIRQN